MKEGANQAALFLTLRGFGEKMQKIDFRNDLCRRQRSFFIFQFGL
jgi:hypothetical protein